MSDIPLIVNVFRDPQTSAALSLSEWELLLRQARASNTLGQLALRLKQGGFDSVLAAVIQQHIDSAARAAEAVHRSVRWEIYQILRALRTLDAPVVFLKGAAYVITANAASRGRLFHDIDFLVPKHRIEEAERLLVVRGWFSGKMSRYDNRYYRKWMHEIPPLKHVERKSVLDVHHAILPETAKSNPDSNLLIQDALINDSYFKDEQLLVLSPHDMVLHSATHLFHDGELEHGFRDLLDLDALFNEFGGQAEFWQGLLPRARQLQLELPLYYALRYCHKLLATPIPDALLQQSANALPSKPRRAMMDFLFLKALLPAHASCDTPTTGLARWALYIRSHYLRMPLYLLIPHLIRKAFVAEEH